MNCPYPTIGQPGNELSNLSGAMIAPLTITLNETTMQQKSSRSAAGICAATAAIYALSLIPLQAFAQGWFAGGTVGSAKQQDYQVGGPISTRDESDGAARLFGGYLISPFQGVVASYVDLGTAYYAGPAFGNFTDSLDADGIDISYMAGWAPGSQQRISLFGTVGLFSWDQDVTYTDATGTYNYSDKGTGFSMGIGTEINLGSSGAGAWGINLEYQLFKDVGDALNSGHEYDRDMFSIGVDYRFGQRNRG